MNLPFCQNGRSHVRLNSHLPCPPCLQLYETSYTQLTGLRAQSLPGLGSLDSRGHDSGSVPLARSAAPVGRSTVMRGARLNAAQISMHAASMHAQAHPLLCHAARDQGFPEYAMDSQQQGGFGLGVDQQHRDAGHVAPRPIGFYRSSSSGGAVTGPGSLHAAMHGAFPGDAGTHAATYDMYCHQVSVTACVCGVRGYEPILLDPMCVLWSRCTTQAALCRPLACPFW